MYDICQSDKTISHLYNLFMASGESSPPPPPRSPSPPPPRSPYPDAYWFLVGCTQTSHYLWVSPDTTFMKIAEKLIFLGMMSDTVDFYFVHRCCIIQNDVVIGDLNIMRDRESIPVSFYERTVDTAAEKVLKKALENVKPPPSEANIHWALRKTNNNCLNALKLMQTEGDRRNEQANKGRNRMEYRQSLLSEINGTSASLRTLAERVVQRATDDDIYDTIKKELDVMALSHEMFTSQLLELISNRQYDVSDAHMDECVRISSQLRIPLGEMLAQFQDDATRTLEYLKSVAG